MARPTRLAATGLLLAQLLGMSPGASASDGPGPAPVSATPSDARDARVTSLLGFNDHPLDGRAPAEASVMLSRVTDLGATFVRIDVHWPWFESTRAGRAYWNRDQVQL